MIGTDIIEISRIKESAKKESFLNGVFTPLELDYYKSKGADAQTLAGMFCAKEAAVKALGTGFSGFRPSDIEVCHTEYGAPKLNFYKNAAKAFAGYKAEVSISHCIEYAMGVCILEKL